MKLEFRGHDDRYAIEQSLLAFFPEERPVYESITPEDDDCALVSLTEGKRYATGVTTLHYHGKTARGVSRAVLTDAPDEYERERLRQRALKLSFFKAARDITGITPAGARSPASGRASWPAPCWSRARRSGRQTASCGTPTSSRRSAAVWPSRRHRRG